MAALTVAAARSLSMSGFRFRLVAMASRTRRGVSLCAISGAGVDQSRSEVLTGIIGARRAVARSLDDFGVVDALEVDRGDAEVAVAELALNDDERHAFASHLDGVGVAQLMRGEPSADTRGRRGAPKLSSSGGGRPLATTRPAVENTEQEGRLEGRHVV